MSFSRNTSNSRFSSSFEDRYDVKMKYSFAEVHIRTRPITSVTNLVFDVRFIGHLRATGRRNTTMTQTKIQTLFHQSKNTTKGYNNIENGIVSGSYLHGYMRFKHEDDPRAFLPQRKNLFYFERLSNFGPFYSYTIHVICICDR